MRVLVNAASANMGGAVTYLQNVLRWLPEIAQRDEFIVILPDHTRAKLVDSARRTNVRFLSFPFSNTGGVARLYFDQVGIPRLLRSLGADVLFSSTGFGTFARGCPEVLLVRNPVYFNADFLTTYRRLGRSLWRNTLRRWYSLWSIRRADVVLFPTEAMREMVEAFHDLEKIRSRAIHYGFDADRFAGNGTTSEAARRAQYLSEEGSALLLNVSTYAVHKNFETLIEALPYVLVNNPSLKLLTTTSRERTSDKSEYDALKERAKELGADHAWVELGYVPYHELHALYQAANAYVFPSFTESFGHSMVEAMASGLPIIAAGTSVNREVCGEAGSYFDTFNPVDCAEAIGSVLDDPERRSKMAEISRERSRSFSWRKYTGELVEVLREARHF